MRCEDVDGFETIFSALYVHTNEFFFLLVYGFAGGTFVWTLSWFYEGKVRLIGDLTLLSRFRLRNDGFGVDEIDKMIPFEIGVICSQFFAVFDVGGFERFFELVDRGIIELGGSIGHNDGDGAVSDLLFDGFSLFFGEMGEIVYVPFAAPVVENVPAPFTLRRTTGVVVNADTQSSLYTVPAILTVPDASVPSDVVGSTPTYFRTTILSK
mgnify:CR=1 FL=1